ncbi:hypothetical protein BD310DRAFT_938696 [Dichomitus squalens]|uniref:Uncharacterized protein n=1 Tax=Dichomitus squalens TaxID=114155 RepID=A0A4Q9PHN1_9APHY|nr:hypothetical protein BD310DRAFT_938696 [Dichomitus squalens]
MLPSSAYPTSSASATTLSSRLPVHTTPQTAAQSPCPPRLQTRPSLCSISTTSLPLPVDPPQSFASPPSLQNPQRNVQSRLMPTYIFLPFPAPSLLHHFLPFPFSPSTTPRLYPTPIQRPALRLS